MTVVAIACVKNEIDIIEAFVRHNLHYVDRLIVLDNGSTDGTRDVLALLQKEGLSLDIDDNQQIGFLQAERTTRLLRDYAWGRYRACWTFALDADEFLHIPNLESLLDAAQKQPFGLCWRTYVPGDNEDSGETNPVLRIVHRLNRESKPVKKVVIPGHFARLNDVRLGPGNHTLWVGENPSKISICPEGHIAHFRVRSPSQYLAKIVIKVLQYYTQGAYDGIARPFYWNAYQELLRDPSALVHCYFQAAREHSQGPHGESNLVYDPIPYKGGPLRYTLARTTDQLGWQSILRYADKLARQYCVLVSSKFERVCPSQIGQQSEALASLHEQLLASEKKALTHYQALQTVFRSPTFRIGRLLMKPIKFAGQLKNRFLWR